MKGAGDLPEKREVQTVERTAISSEEIGAALAKRCPVGAREERSEPQDSRSVSPLSDDLPSNVEEEEDESEEDGEGDGEAINEKEKKTKRLEHLITTHYNASKCVVLCLVCSTNTPRSVAPPVQLAHALNEIVAADRIKEHKAQQTSHELPVHHVQRLQLQLYSSLPTSAPTRKCPMHDLQTHRQQAARRLRSFKQRQSPDGKPVSHPVPHSVRAKTLHPREETAHQNHGDGQLQAHLEDLLADRVHRIGEPNLPHVRSRVPAVPVDRVDHPRGNPIADFAAFPEIQENLQLVAEEEDSERNPRENSDEACRRPQFRRDSASDGLRRRLQDTADHAAFEAI